MNFVSTVIVMMGLLIGLNASSDQGKLNNQERSHFTVSSIEVQEEGVEFSVLQESACQPVVKKNDFFENFDWDSVVNIGKQIWTVVEQNSPKVTTEIQAANAIPDGIKNWFELECWQPTTARAYRVTYKNMLGVKVVDFGFKVLYSHGGRLNGRGLYLSQVTVVPSDLSVAWGYTFNARVGIDNVTNAGTSRSPVGAIQFSLLWSLKTPLKYMEARENYYVRGDGFFQRL